MYAHRGSALFLILIAVALFAALSYAVTQTGRGSGTTAKEDLTLCLAEIDSHFKAVESAVTRIKAQGYADHQIDGYSNIYKNKNGSPLGAANGACTSDDCRIFADRGGYATPLVLPDKCLDLTDNFFVGSAAGGHTYFQVYRVPGVGSQTENSLYAQIIRISDEVCKAYNTRAGFAAPPFMGTSTWFGNRTAPSNYSGTLASFPPDAGEDLGLLGIPATVPTNGEPTFCWTLDTALGTRAISYVVLVR